MQNPEPPINPTKRKINWLGLIVELVKAATAFFAGGQILN